MYWLTNDGNGGNRRRRLERVRGRGGGGGEECLAGAARVVAALVLQLFVFDVLGRALIVRRLIAVAHLGIGVDHLEVADVAERVAASGVVAAAAQRRARRCLVVWLFVDTCLFVRVVCDWRCCCGRR